MPWREFGSDAARTLRPSRGEERERLERAVTELAIDPRRPEKAIKAIEGRHDGFSRLRVGDRRILYELDDVHEVVLAEAIVARKDLDTWLRSKR